MMALANPVQIKEAVKKQLWNYSYTCPIAPNVSRRLTLDSV